MGNRIAPTRFLVFLVLLIVASGIATAAIGMRHGILVGFDVAALVFLASCWPLLHFEADEMRAAAERNDANRMLLLGITLAVTAVVLVAVAAELTGSGKPGGGAIALIVGTLALAWLFSNTMYALHYAHMFYKHGDGGSDCGGVKFPDSDEPDYWDFIYFAFCLGMTFQTSDVDIQTDLFRRVVTAHCLAAFVFNLGIVAFTINVLGSS